MQIDFATDPARYRHWRLDIDGPVARLTLDVDPAGGLFAGAELKLNSYDLGVDIELADAVTRLRFEHPEVRAVVIGSGKPNVFCAGANIGALARASHAHKVNFCKFTNETRLAIEDASANSGQRYLAAVNGTAAGGGYELALACDHIMLIDDRRSAVSLPEVPLLAVLPGTGGLTRLTDKRRVRRDRADIFCTAEEGVRGRRALDWRLVDELVQPSSWEERVRERALALAAGSDAAHRTGVKLPPLDRTIAENGIAYRHIRGSVRLCGAACHGHRARPTTGAHRPHRHPRRRGRVLAACNGARAGRRDPTPAVQRAGTRPRRLPLRGRPGFGRRGRPAAGRPCRRLVRARNQPLAAARLQAHRCDRAQPGRADRAGHCFAGFLAELVFVSDRAFMFAGTRAGDNSGAATLTLSRGNFGAYPMGNGLGRLQTRFLGEPDLLKRAEERIGESLSAEDAEALGLVTASWDEVDWDEEIRLVLEERASFSPDALTGLEANLRAAGPETMETKIFGRLSAWQNWIFQRPNAVGNEGALKRYGTGQRPRFDPQRT